MLRIFERKDPASAKRYYTADLARSDYYSTGRDTPGLWGGKAAKLLGLEGHETPEVFGRLCDNILPDGSGPLTGRTKANRRTGYDFSFHCPKSLSVVYALTGDEALRTAFAEAVSETMDRIEADAKTRVRVGGANDDRGTGNLLWASFVHSVTRPVDGVPDPHLHLHVFVFNATHDGVEGRWKAAQFGDIIKSAPYYEACFHSSLSAKVVKLGYAVERRGGFWEIAAVPQSAIDKYSRRTEEIERTAKERGITDPKQKDALGARTRRSKSEAKPWPEVEADWKARLTPQERRAVVNAKGAGHQSRLPSAKEAVEHGLAVALGRSSVAEERRILEHALRFGFGGVSVEAAMEELARSGVVVRRGASGKTLVSEKSMLEREARMVSLARKGRGALKAMNPQGLVSKYAGFTERQLQAIEQILRSPDRVALFRMVGEGPTAVAIKEIEAAGYRVTQLDARPTKGEPGADQCSRLIEEVKSKVKQGGVLWINHAVRLGVESLARLFEEMQRLDGRIVLSGQPIKKGPVELRGALDALERLSGVSSGEVERGKQRWNDTQAAVQAAREGHSKQALDGLDRLGEVRQLTAKEIPSAAANEYAKAARRKKRVTIRAGRLKEKVTEAVRAVLQLKRLLGRRSRKVEQLTRAMSDQQSKESVHYKKGQIVVFYKSVKGFKAGHRYKVIGKDPFGNVLAREIRYTRPLKLAKRVAFDALPLSKSRCFGVFNRKEIEIARGEKIRITAAGRTLNQKLGLDKLLSKRQRWVQRENYRMLEKHLGLKKHFGIDLVDRRYKVRKGSVYRVKGFTLKGNIKLDNGWVLPRKFGHLDYAYCENEGVKNQPVDRLIVLDSESKGPDFDKTGFPPGLRSVVVFTESKDRLFESLRQSGKVTGARKTTGGKESGEPHGRDKSEGREPGR